MKTHTPTLEKENHRLQKVLIKWKFGELKIMLDDPIKAETWKIQECKVLERPNFIVANCYASLMIISTEKKYIYIYILYHN